MPEFHPELVASIRQHEGFRARAYQDSVGVWTIGYGTNLQATEIDEATAMQWLLRDMAKVKRELVSVEGFLEADEVRQGVLIEMAYQLGVRGCLKFKKMWAAVVEKDWWAAGSEMLDSRWADQTPRRVEALVARMRFGTWSGKRRV